MDLCHFLGPHAMPVAAVVLIYVVMILIGGILGWVRETPMAALRSAAKFGLAILILCSLLATWETRTHMFLIWDAGSCRPLGPAADKTIVFGLNLLVIAVPYVMGRWRRSMGAG